jgi:hypothetical protein
MIFPRFYLVMGLDDLWRVRDSNRVSRFNDSRGMSYDDANHMCGWLNQRFNDGRL